MCFWTMDTLRWYKQNWNFFIYINVKRGRGVQGRLLYKREKHLISKVAGRSRDKQSISLNGKSTHEHCWLSGHRDRSKTGMWQTRYDGEGSCYDNCHSNHTDKEKTKTAIIWWKRKTKRKASKYFEITILFQRVDKMYIHLIFHVNKLLLRFP